MYSRLFNFLEMQKILFEKQFGFREKTFNIYGTYDSCW